MNTNLKKTILLIITFVLLYFVFRNINVNELLKQFSKIDYKYIALLVISIVISLSFRGLCFKQLIYKTADIPVIESAMLCITSSALNIVLPARIGDIFRACFTGDKYKVSRAKIFGAVMFERIIDMIVICLLLLFAIFVYNRNELAIKLCCVSFGIFLLSLLFAVLTYKYNHADSICNILNKFFNKIHCSEFSDNIVCFVNKIYSSFSGGFEIIDSPKRMLLVFLTSVVIWIFDCFDFVCVIWAFNLSIHWSCAIFISCFIVFACLIPSASIFIGPYQIAVITAFAIYNVSKESALAVTFVEQTVVLITTGLIAVLFLLKNNISLDKVKNDIK